MDVVNLLSHANPTASAKGKPASAPEAGGGFDDALKAARGTGARKAETPARAPTARAADGAETRPDARHAKLADAAGETLLERLDAADLLAAGDPARDADKPRAEARKHADDDAPEHAGDGATLAAQVLPLLAAAQPAQAVADASAAPGTPGKAGQPPALGGKPMPTHAARVAGETLPQLAQPTATGAKPTATPAQPDGSLTPAPTAAHAAAPRHARQPALAAAAPATTTANPDASAVRSAASAGGAFVTATLTADASRQASAPAAGDSATSALNGLFGLGAAAPTGAAAQAATPAPVAPLMLQSPIGSTPWQQELGLQLVQLTQRGGHQVELHLNPRDLGPLTISLTLDHQGAQAQFFAAHAVVRDAVQQAIPELRAALAGQGIALGEAMVGQQQQQQQAPGGFARATPGGGSGDGSHGIEGVSPVAAPRPAARIAPGAGVDLYA